MARSFKSGQVEKQVDNTIDAGEMQSEHQFLTPAVIISIIIGTPVLIALILVIVALLAGYGWTVLQSSSQMPNPELDSLTGSQAIGY